MKPPFALNLDHDGLALLHRASGGWQIVGKVPLDDPELPVRLAMLQRTATSLAGGAMATKLIIPNSEILYRLLPCSGDDAHSRRASLEAALDGLTPYRPDEIVFDWRPAGPGQAQLAAVARETLAEAEEFALRHRFNPVSFVAIPEPGSFAGEPFFGPTRCAEEILGPSRQPEPDAEPVRILRPTAPQSPPAASDSLSGRVAEEPERPAPQENAADAPAPRENAAGHGPMRRDDGGSPPPPPGSPQPAFVSRRAAAGVPPEIPARLREMSSRLHPREEGRHEQAAAEPLAAPDGRAASPPGAPAGEEVPAPAPARHEPARESGLQVAARSLAQRIAAAPHTAPMQGMMQKLGGGKRPGGGAAERSAPGTRTPDPDRPAAERGWRQRPGLIGGTLLAATLLIGGVLAWPDALFDRAERPPDADTAGPGALAVPAPPPAPGGSGSAVPSRLPAPLPPGTLRAEAPPTPAAAPGAVPPHAPGSAPAPGPEVKTALGAPPAVAPAGGETDAPPAASAGQRPPPHDMSPDPAELADTEPELPATAPEGASPFPAGSVGAGSAVPAQVPGPAGNRPEEPYLPSIDRRITIHDAVALPPADAGANTDLRPPGRFLPPPPPGSRFELDARGLVRPSPEGTLSPEGILVYAGRPGAVAPPRPAGAWAESATAPQSMETPPPPRPENLLEMFERARLGGRTRAELARIRPLPRPRALQEALARDDGSPTGRAPTRSVRPLPRPAGLADAVRRAQAETAAPSSPAQAPAGTATAALAPARAPSLPSNADVAREATVRNAISLSRINLIGVYGSASERRALVRLKNGRFVKVRVGDRLDGGQVAEISGNRLKYIKRGRVITLEIAS